MRLLSLVIGIAVGASLGFAAGYNYGRGAPILSNPFVKQDPLSRLQRSVDRAVDDARNAIEDSHR
jgi:hypothetical protein